MKMPRKGERGFTLIELLIVVAILGVLAAVIIPNVGQFLGRGQTEAQKTEYHNISAAVTAMMVDNNIYTLPNPTNVAGLIAYNDMAFVSATPNRGFPDFTTDGTDKGYGDDTIQAGYVLHGHVKVLTASTTSTQNYVNVSQSQYYYTCESDGTVRQWDDAAMTTELSSG
ncbi:type II secretion system protein [Chloroflexota bacterium]